MFELFLSRISGARAVICRKKPTLKDTKNTIITSNQKQRPRSSFENPVRFLRTQWGEVILPPPYRIYQTVDRIHTLKLSEA
jgi:hypothetical protein